MKTAYIYLRVSTDEQATEGFSLKNQENACKDYARNHDLYCTHIFEPVPKS